MAAQSGSARSFQTLQSVQEKSGPGSVSYGADLSVRPDMRTPGVCWDDRTPRSGLVHGSSEGLCRVNNSLGLGARTISGTATPSGQESANEVRPTDASVTAGAKTLTPPCRPALPSEVRSMVPPGRISVQFPGTGRPPRNTSAARSKSPLSRAPPVVPADASWARVRSVVHTTLQPSTGTPTVGSYVPRDRSPLKPEHTTEPVSRQTNSRNAAAQSPQSVAPSLLLDLKHGKSAPAPAHSRARRDRSPSVAGPDALLTTPGGSGSFWKPPTAERLFEADAVDMERSPRSLLWSSAASPSPLRVRSATTPQVHLASLLPRPPTRELDSATPRIPPCPTVHGAHPLSCGARVALGSVSSGQRHRATPSSEHLEREAHEGTLLKGNLVQGNVMEPSRPLSIPKIGEALQEVAKNAMKELREARREAEAALRSEHVNETLETRSPVHAERQPNPATDAPRGSLPVATSKVTVLGYICPKCGVDGLDTAIAAQMHCAEPVLGVRSQDEAMNRLRDGFAKSVAVLGYVCSKCGEAGFPSLDAVTEHCLVCPAREESSEPVVGSDAKRLDPLPRTQLVCESTSCDSSGETGNNGNAPHGLPGVHSATSVTTVTREQVLEPSPVGPPIVASPPSTESLHTARPADGPLGCARVPRSSCWSGPHIGDKPPAQTGDVPDDESTADSASRCEVQGGHVRMSLKVDGHSQGSEERPVYDRAQHQEPLPVAGTGLDACPAPSTFAAESLLIQPVPQLVGEPVAFNERGQVVIARHVDENGKGRTVVLHDGEMHAFGKTTVESLVESTDDDVSLWLEKLSDVQSHGLVHELGQRLLSNSRVYQGMRNQWDAISQGANYTFFNLTEECTEKELDNAYRQMAKRMHPDKNGGTEEAKERFQKMKDRYESLKEFRAGPSDNSKSVDQEKEDGRKEAYDEDEQEEKPKGSTSMEYDPKDRASLDATTFKMLSQLKVMFAGLETLKMQIRRAGCVVCADQ